MRQIYPVRLAPLALHVSSRVGRIFKDSQFWRVSEMAEVVRKKVQWGREKYSFPWGNWTNGKVWKAKMGVDFKSSICRFRQRLYARSTLTGLRVRTKVDGDFVIWQFYELEVEK